jgi:hypothetical protein
VLFEPSEISPLSLERGNEALIELFVAEVARIKVVIDLLNHCHMLHYGIVALELLLYLLGLDLDVVWRIPLECCSVFLEKQGCIRDIALLTALKRPLKVDFTFPFLLVDELNYGCQDRNETLK